MTKLEKAIRAKVKEIFTEGQTKYDYEDIALIIKLLDEDDEIMFYVEEINTGSDYWTEARTSVNIVDEKWYGLIFDYDTNVYEGEIEDVVEQIIDLEARVQSVFKRIGLNKKGGKK